MKVPLKPGLMADAVTVTLKMSSVSSVPVSLSVHKLICAFAVRSHSLEQEATCEITMVSVQVEVKPSINVSVMS